MTGLGLICELSRRWPTFVVFAIVAATVVLPGCSSGDPGTSSDTGVIPESEAAYRMILTAGTPSSDTGVIPESEGAVTTSNSEREASAAAARAEREASVAAARAEREASVASTRVERTAPVAAGHGERESSAVVGSILAELRASRSFAGPGEYPPANFAGYGIVAFPEAPSPERGSMFCGAYRRALLTVATIDSVGTPIAEQMVTVWPVTNLAIARNLQEGIVGCDSAVENYNLAEAQVAIENAGRAERRTIGYSSLTRRGPYLLAWSPGRMKGSQDTLVLVSDLSAVSSPEQALVEFRRWRSEIQQRPDLWHDGWSAEQVRITIQRWSDQRAEAVLTLIGLR